jgi:tol-pal system protein YbgF
MHFKTKMHFKTMIGCAVLAPLVYASPLLAQGNAGQTAAEAPMTLLAFNFLGLETARQAAPRSAVTLAQAAEPQINDLQEQVRKLNGKVEELNFQIIQMQDQMRKQQQDNEFRFEQLEKKRTDAGADTGTDVARTGRDAGSSSGDVKSIIDASGNTSSVASGNPGGEKLGAPPRNFGTIKFDAKGNVVGETAVPGAASPDSAGQGGAGQSGASQGGAVVASLPATDDPEELYRNSYQLILSGDYKAAETGFREHIKRYPNDPRAADVHFWLGEALLGQDRYRDAAQVFLDANKAYPKAKKAPDMLLKLGVSLSAMNQREVACGTYRSIGERYPRASAALKDRVKQEEALAGC